MSMLSDETIRNKLTEALNEPSVPQAFVERMVVRAEGITRGREAEQQLVSARPEQKEALVARALVGRLMLRQVPPEGATNEQMEAQMLALPGVRALAQEPTEKILNELKNGRAILKTAGKENDPLAAKAPEKTPEKSKQLSVPEREQPKL